jgi:hypothetical protein
MNKWYRPFSLMLVAAMASELCGCAQTGAWLAKRTSKIGGGDKLVDAKKADAKNADSKNADSKKKSSDRDSANLAANDLAEDKPDNSKVAKVDSKGSLNVAAAAAADQAKLVAAKASAKTGKSTKLIEAVDEGIDTFASTPAAAKKAKSAVNKSIEAVNKGVEEKEDALDAFLAKIETPAASVKGFAKGAVPEKGATSKPAANDFDFLSEGVDQLNEKVVQVKKEVSTRVKGLEDEVADWAAEDLAENLKTVSPASASKTSSTTDEAAFSATKPTATKPTAAGDLAQEPRSEVPDFSLEGLKKTALKKVTESGLLALCPQAEGELLSLLKGMDSSSPDSLKRGLSQIGQLGAKGAAATPLLQSFLKHEDAFVRTHAALAMARLKLTSNQSVHVVTDALKSPDANLRSFGTAVLSEMGPQSNQVLTSLSESLNDKDGQVRLRAAEALIHHDGFAYPALQCLLTSLTDKKENTRWLATYSLAELAPESQEAVQGLLKATQDPAAKVRIGAVYALGEIGPFAKSANQDLQKLHDTTTDAELKTAIEATLLKIVKSN